ncbi:ABC transporter ATP-binding protein [Thermococcus sp.]
MLKVEELYFSYGDFGIGEINLEVNEGELVVIIGPNGAGKSTLLRAIYGLLKPSKGRVTVNGKDVHSLSPGERARLLGYVPQSHIPTFPFKTRDFVLLGVTPEIGVFGAPGKRHLKRAEELLRLFGLGDYGDRPYTSLSGGQMRLLLLARALMTSPRYLLLDEPTSELDLKNSLLVMQTVKRLTRKGVGVLAVLHDPNLAYPFADRVALMGGGKIIAVGKPDDVLEEELLSEVYGIELKLIECNGERFLRGVIL